MSPAGHAGVPGLAYRLVGTGISSGSITDLTKCQGQAIRNLKYIKAGLSYLFAYQSPKSVVWAMELAINAIWSGLARLFDGASPGPRAACLRVPVQCVGPKVSQLIINDDLRSALSQTP